MRTPRLRERRRAAQRLLPVAIALSLAGCATQPLLTRARAARGGPVDGIVLNAAARVYTGVPGRWRYTRTYLSPDRYAWRIETAGDPDTYIFDGTVVRSFVGDGETSVDASTGAPLRGHARWTGLSLLDGLDAPGVTVAELATAEVPDDAREGLQVRFADGATYRLGFDAAARLTSIEGPLDLSPLASGIASARYGDHRSIAGVVLPFRVSYYAGTQRVADEVIQAACVNPPLLTPASFQNPEQLPTCPAPSP